MPGIIPDRVDKPAPGRSTLLSAASAPAAALGLAVACLGGLIGCERGDVSIDLTRDEVSFHLGRADCAVHYTAVGAAPPKSVDLNCPPNLQASSTRPALLLSVPLTTTTRAGATPLLDPKYGDAGHMPGHFLTVTYHSDGDIVVCDPKVATGSIEYTSLPVPGSGDPQRLAGSFSADAALDNCYSGAGPSAGDALRLSGQFDLPVPFP
jgi:hypothetical protein